MKKALIIVIFILSICCSLFLVGKLYFLGSQSEREEILSATVWQLSKEGHKESEIEKIYVDYDPMKGGIKPYNYKVEVIFKKDTSTAQTYSWISEQKKEVENISITIP